MSVLVNNDGFITRDGRRVAWPTVRAIVTYKHDLFVYDDVCIAFKIGDDVWVEVSEDEFGFRTLVTEVERRFPDLPRDWYYEVMFPAFVANFRVLWGTM